MTFSRNFVARALEVDWIKIVVEDLSKYFVLIAEQRVLRGRKRGSLSSSLLKDLRYVWPLGLYMFQQYLSMPSDRPLFDPLHVSVHDGGKITFRHLFAGNELEGVYFDAGLLSSFHCSRGHRIMNPNVVNRRPIYTKLWRGPGEAILQFK